MRNGVEAGRERDAGDGRGAARSRIGAATLVAGLAAWSLLAAAGAARAGCAAGDGARVAPAVALVDGVRCVTRGQPRAVGWNQYVIDRVTECRLTTPGAAQGIPAISWTTASGSGEPEPAAPALSLVRETLPPGPERRPVWSADRRVFRNAQADRSLRVLDGAIRRVRP